MKEDLPEQVVMLNDFSVHFLQVVLYSRSVDRQLAKRLERSTWLCDRSVREALGFRDEVDLGVSWSSALDVAMTHDVHSESIASLLKPPVHKVPDCVADLGVLPVEIGLLA